MAADPAPRHLFAVNTDGLAAVRAHLDGFCPARLAALTTTPSSPRPTSPEQQVAHAE